jgi:hypothetical protein
MRQALLALTFAATLLASLPAHAGLRDDITRFRLSPSADLAVRISEAHLKAGRLGAAMNWSETATRCPDAKGDHVARAARMRKRLRWSLRDRGLGAFFLAPMPSTATVRIDDVEITPKARTYTLWLKEGSHQLSVTARDHEPVSRIITVSRDERRKLILRMRSNKKPQLHLDVEPKEAELWIDNIFIGYAVVTPVTLAPGGHMVELRLKGYKTWIKQVKVDNGAEVPIEVKLEADRDKGFRYTVVKAIDRPLSPLEKRAPGRMGPEMKRGDRRGPQEVAPLVVEGEVGGGAAAVAPPERVEPDRSGDAVVAVEVTRDGEPLDEGFAADGGDAGISGGGGASWKRAHTGWLLTGGGLASVAAGSGLALIGAQNAADANALRLGHPDYETEFAAARRLALVGYGVAGLGVASTVAGGVILWGRGGLDRDGKGWLLTGVGAATAGGAVWLLFNAMKAAEEANDLPVGHHAYDARYAQAQRSSWTAWGVGAAAAGLTGAGVYLLATKGGSRSAAWGGSGADDEGATGTATARVLPVVGPGHLGLSLSAPF